MNKGVRLEDVARRLVMGRQWVWRWGGLEQRRRCGAQSKILGRSCGSGFRAVRRIEVLERGAVLAGYPTELCGLARVRNVIAQRFGRGYNEAQASRLLKSLGFRCQRPTGRAVQRDRAAIRQWQQRWSASKRTLKKKAKR